MSLEHTREELRLADGCLETVQGGLDTVRTKYGTTVEKLGELLIPLQVTMPAQIKTASEKYEAATNALRSAMEVFTTKVLPNLEAAGLDGVGPEAQTIVYRVRDLGGENLQGATKLVMEHVFRRDTFGNAAEKVGALTQQVVDYRTNLQMSLLDEDAALPQITAATDTLRTSLAAYNGQLDA